jgi:hypothetical protein
MGGLLSGTTQALSSPSRAQTTLRKAYKRRTRAARLADAPACGFTEAAVIADPSQEPQHAVVVEVGRRTQSKALADARLLDLAAEGHDPLHKELMDPEMDPEHESDNAARLANIKRRLARPKPAFPVLRPGRCASMGCVRG